jgi:hypothetical protein
MLLSSGVKQRPHTCVTALQKNEVQGNIATVGQPYDLQDRFLSLIYRFRPAASPGSLPRCAGGKDSSCPLYENILAGGNRVLLNDTLLRICHQDYDSETGNLFSSPAAWPVGGYTPGPRYLGMISSWFRDHNLSFIFSINKSLKQQ